MGFSGMSPDTRYSPLEWSDHGSKQEAPDEDDIRSEFSDSEKQEAVGRRRISWWKEHGLWIAHGILVSLYLVVLIYSKKTWHAKQGHSGCVDKTHGYSPINDAIEEEYVGTWFKGSLWYDSPYKGPPTPEKEQAWQDLMQYGAVSITEEDILGIGHNLTAVKYPPEVGGGYLGVALGVHQLHCLHYLWQDHHIAYFEKTQANKAGTPDMYERHYEHCIDFLRQALMCNFDPGILPFYWVNQHQQPTPDGNTFHKCVNWDSLQTWLKQRSVTLPEGFQWHQPPDAVPLPHNP